MQAVKIAGAIPRAEGPPIPPCLGDWLSCPDRLQTPVAEIDGMLWAGRSTLLSGLPKAGKSTLLAQIAAAKTTGGMMFGKPMHQGTVLWFAFDEHVGDAVRRLRDFGADHCATRITAERPTDVTAMMAIIEAIDAKLVIVDTITRWWMGRVQRSNDAEEVRQFLAPYLDALRDAGVSSMFSHHANKQGLRASGSVALEAEVDAPLVLVHPSQRKLLNASGTDEEDISEAVEDDGRRIVQGVSRFGPHTRIALRYDDGRFFLDQGTEPREIRILRAASLQHGPFSKNELAHGGNKQSMLDEIDRLRRNGLLTEIRGKYAISERGRTHLHHWLAARDAVATQ